jgi:transposase-like protein
VIDPKNVEVVEKAKRRRFDAEYKARILRDVDAGPSGGIGALLRREGLYFSHLITWRKQREKGGLAALEPKKRGPKSRKPSAEALRNIQLERENKKLQHRLKQAETIIEFQKKVHEILGIPLGTPPEDDATS